MKTVIAVLIVFVSEGVAGQISGIVTEGKNESPLPYVNVWVKNTLMGSTTGEDGKFLIENASIGDTIHISNLGYQTIAFPAKKENKVVLQPKNYELNEVVVIPMKNSTEYFIKSFKRAKRNRRWYNNGHYSLARFYEYKQEYENTPFVSQISLITNNAKKEKVTFRIRLVKAGPNGEPSENGLTEKIILESEEGVNKVVVDLKDRKLIFPENGLFVVVDRLNLKENKHFNKRSNMDILQPAIGVERKEQEKNTWLGYGGKWILPKELKEYLGTNVNIAVNIKLIN